MAHSLIYTDDPITEKEWEQILGLQLISGLTGLLTLLHSRGNEAIPVAELPDFFKGSHVEQLNGQFSKHKLLYRAASAGNQSWTMVLPYEKRSLKLYKGKQREKKEVKPKGSPRCPPIFFNPNWNKPASDTTGKVMLSFVGIKDEARPWTHVEMEIKAGLSVGLAGKGFIHLLPTRLEMDKIIAHLQEMRNLIPEE